MRGLMRELNCSRYEAIGILVMLWTWALYNADRDGNLENATADDIADGLMARGPMARKVVDALEASGWLHRIDECSYMIHDWDV